MEKVNLLITGANGFIGKNLICQLESIKTGMAKADFIVGDIYRCDIDTTAEELDSYTKTCDFVFHFAGIMRPENNDEFMAGNFGFTTTLLECLKKNSNKSPILMSSSIQSSLTNEYGRSKKAGEDYLIAYGIECGVTTYVYRLTNVFGKWNRPNYNSVIATFCNNIAKGLPININDVNHEMTLIHIDDVVGDFLGCITKPPTIIDGYCKVMQEHKATLGYIADTLHGYKNSRQTLMTPVMKDNSLEKKLYSTYLSYLKEDDFGYDLKMNIDNRGSFTEFIKMDGYGQVSVNTSHPHIVKGNHWHHTKNEKFLVVSGKGVIRFRKIGDSEVIEYLVSGDKLQVIDIPCGYTHNIENLGDADMVTIMWANEIFDPSRPDTYYEEV